MLLSSIHNFRYLETNLAKLLALSNGRTRRPYKMKIKKLLTAALSALAFAALAMPAAAQMKGGNQESAWYIGGSIGQSRARDVCSIGVFAGCDYKDTAWRLL